MKSVSQLSDRILIEELIAVSRQDGYLRGRAKRFLGSSENNIRENNRKLLQLKSELIRRLKN